MGTQTSTNNLKLNNMLNNIIKLSELAELLEYNDERSVINWCKKNGILVAHLGKAKYVATTQVNKYFESKFKGFVETKYTNSQQIMDAHNKDDKVGLAESMDAPITPNVKKKYKTKTQRSKASEDLFTNLKKSA